jgi:hypothetical protein
LKLNIVSLIMRLLIIGGEKHWGNYEKANQSLRSRIRFDHNQLSGSFGVIGTDLPLISGMIAGSRINGAGVFVIFGLMQVTTALIYEIPMPVQPLKALALIVITQKISGDILYGGGYLSQAGPGSDPALRRYFLGKEGEWEAVLALLSSGRTPSYVLGLER